LSGSFLAVGRIDYATGSYTYLMRTKLSFTNKPGKVVATKLADLNC